MTEPAAPQAMRRRPALGTALLLVAYVMLGPPLFLLGPLLLLLVASRPRTFREWLWIGLTGYAAFRLLSSVDPAPILNRLMLVAAGTLTASFLVFGRLLKAQTPTAKAALAVGAATVAVAFWAASAGISLGDLDQATLAEYSKGVKLILEGASSQQLDDAMAAGSTIVRIFPGFLATQAMIGLILAWAWYHLVARSPWPKPAAPAGTFSFNDHLIWGAIFTIALAVLPVADWLARLGQNWLVIWAALYAARGVAIAIARIHPWPIPIKLFVLAFGLLTFPITAGSLITLGVADTWLDFRRLRSATAVGGNDAD